LIAELQRRRVIRALVGYGIGAYAVLQIVEPIMHGFHWPDAVLTYIVAALAIGFPIVVSLAWIFDVNAGRVERTGPAAGLGGARLAAILVGIGVLAAAPGTIWYFFVRKPAQPAPGAGDVATAPSIAVLPRTAESRSAARVDCFPPRRSTKTDASTRARSWRTSGSAQSSRSAAVEPQLLQQTLAGP